MTTNRPVLCIFSALLCATAACAPVGRGIQRVGTNIHEETVAMDHRVRDWFDSENEELSKRNLPAPTTAYCYKTLGDVSCYAQQIPGQERRLVGKQEPEPMFAELEIPIPETKPEVPVIVVAETTNASTEATEVVDASIPVTVEEIPAYRQPRTLIPVFEGDVN